MRRIEDVAVLDKVSRELYKASNGKIIPSLDEEYENCWSFVARSAGWIPSARWLQPDVMNKLLLEHTVTVPMQQAKLGDILAYYGTGEGYYVRGELIHTAFVIQRGLQILHKRGTYPVSLEGYTDEPAYLPADLRTLRILD